MSASLFRNLFCVLREPKGLPVILVDGGPLVALVDADDQYHEQCVSTPKSLQEPLARETRCLQDSSSDPSLNHSLIRPSLHRPKSLANALVLARRLRTALELGKLN